MSQEEWMTAIREMVSVLDEALAVLSLPRIVGRGANPKDPDNPEEENDILAANGPGGPRTAGH